VAEGRSFSQTFASQKGGPSAARLRCPARGREVTLTLTTAYPGAALPSPAAAGDRKHWTKVARSLPGRIALKSLTKPVTNACRHYVIPFVRLGKKSRT
jgi:hypothetical protein